MEKPMKTSKIPKTDSIEELARFWDTHDLTDFEDELEEVREPVFERGPEETVSIQLPAEEIEAVKNIAEAKGIKHTALIREWVIEKLRNANPTVRGPIAVAKRSATQDKKKQWKDIDLTNANPKNRLSSE
jgi:predicted DNA binding CopG/RHH family protein